MVEATASASSSAASWSKKETAAAAVSQILESSPPSRLREPGTAGTVVITHPDTAVTLPFLKCGYRTTPMSWKELHHILDVSVKHNLEENLAKLSRSEAQQRVYEVFRHHMKQQYVSSVDHILISKFNVPAVLVKANESSESAVTVWKWQAKESLKEMDTSMLRLLPNDFPYFVEDDIRHFILWKTKDSITMQEVEDAKVELRTVHGATDILHWINPPALQSLPDFDHVHFLFLIERQ